MSGNGGEASTATSRAHNQPLDDVPAANEEG